MECQCCGGSHDPMDSCVLYQSTNHVYFTATDYPRYFLTEGGVAVVYVVLCESARDCGDLTAYFKEVEHVHGWAVSANLPTVEHHATLHEPEVGCYYVYRWHPELLDVARKWKGR